MNAPLRIERQDAAWTFVLQRPEKRNALSAELVAALHDGVDQAHAAHAQVLVFRGEGANFSAGFDFSGVQAQSEADLLLRFVRIEMLLQAVAASPCLTVGLAHGRNFGAGVDLFAVCRRRIAAAGTTFRMPGLKFGLVLGTRRFAGIVGAERAREILAQSQTFDAASALAMGFIQQIDEPDQWDAAAAGARVGAGALDEWTRKALHHALSSRDGDADLADLVRSAARPGMKERIALYLAAG